VSGVTASQGVPSRSRMTRGGETLQPGRADAEPSLGGRRQAGRGRRWPHEVEPNKRECRAAVGCWDDGPGG
jgi:hypothetical protein